MRFGRCTDCNQYKYLKEKSMCPTCLDQENNWAVYRVVGLSRPKLVEKGLSKHEAKSRAENKKYLFASEIGKVANA